MIDRVASNMLGEMPWPPTLKQGLGVGIALAEVGMAMYLWDRAKKGSMSVSPWKLRTYAVVAGAMALWAIYNVRVANGANGAAGPASVGVAPAAPAPASAATSTPTFYAPMPLDPRNFV